MEYLFKGYSKNDGWEIGDLIRQNGRTYIQRMSCGKYKLYEVEPESVGIYTNKKDYEGFGIYTGNLIEFLKSIKLFNSDKKIFEKKIYFISHMWFFHEDNFAPSLD